MTIYIVSYTCYDEYDNNLYTWRKPFKDFDLARLEFQRSEKSAREDISFSGDEDVDYDEEKHDNCCIFERQDSYSKIIVELTEHEI